MLSHLASIKQFITTIFLFEVTEADDEDYDSVDSSEASAPRGRGHEVTGTSDEVTRGHLTDDSGVDSITVSPTREAGGMMETLLTMGITGEKKFVMSEIDICGQRDSKQCVVDSFSHCFGVRVFTDDCFVSDEKLEGTQGHGGHSSFLHSGAQWQRELLLNNNNSSNSNVRLTSVSHRREDSDDIRSDSSSDNIAEDNDEDSDDTNSSGPGPITLHSLPINSLV